MNTSFHPERWKHASPEGPGLHTVIDPEGSECRVVRIRRLNLNAGARHTLESGDLECHGVLVAGSAVLWHGGVETSLERFDSFYLPGGGQATIEARAPLVVYIGAAPCEGVGAFYTRRFDPALPIGPIRQVHGKPPYERSVFMTLDPGTPASRLIAGLTWSAPGAWTSWPPHQHEKDLEEVYGYFDMPPPSFGLHLSYLEPGRPGVVHTVASGVFVEAPVGYHPTVATPGVRNAYFWVLAAHRRASRRYDLAVEDPHFASPGA